MHRFFPFNVSPCIPRPLCFLETLAGNLWWSWNDDAISVFDRISPRIFKSVNNNPLRLLSRVGQERLSQLAADHNFLNQLAQVRKRFEEETLKSRHWEDTNAPRKCIGYFSLEYGLNENLHLYSGGLGVLAGDHLKSASDLDLPVVGVGLFYREGYFQQSIDPEGRQQEHYIENAIQDLPIKRVLDKSGKPVQVAIPLPGQEMRAAVWRVNVGRIPLFLLDTNISDNPSDLRSVTGRLYSSDRHNRLLQELLLGIGGFRALTGLGFEVAVSHMNEGHAAFLALARLEHICRELELDLDVAREITRRTSVFTTHTPVPAGNETFDLSLALPCLEEIERTMDIPAHLVADWGRPTLNDTNGAELSMTVLGFNMSDYNNGVSRLHGEVERKMWSHLWPDFPEDEVPISHITNGVHVPSWISPENAALADRYLGRGWHLRADVAGKLISRIDHIPDDELWQAQEVARSRLVRCAREHVESRMRDNNATRTAISAARNVLDPDALTIGFARRFATYKRANLILKDLPRLERLLNDNERPVQIIIAGKAHPADEEGKNIIREMVSFASRRNISRRVVFLENYDMRLARYLVRGVDVWLNTPRRPHEASGTSGMKACINGGLHFSILDGWWSEGYDPACGWAIGNGEHYEDERYQDMIDAQSLFNTLENEILPCFYDRSIGDVPNRWVAMMKASMRMAMEKFSSHRMVSDYNHQVYEKAMRSYDELTAGDAHPARELVARRRRLDENWDAVRISQPWADQPVADMHVGDSFVVNAKVNLGALEPADIDVELYYGSLDASGKVKAGKVKLMDMVERMENGEYVYRQTLECLESGRFAYSARVRPKGNEWAGYMPGYIRWPQADKEVDVG